MNLNSGKLVILIIAAAAFIAAGGAWWHQRQQGRRVLAYWGAGTALLIRRAEHVTLLTLKPTQTTGEEPPVQSDLLQGYTIVDRHEISQARGLIHARQALISDPSYIWKSTPATNPRWEFALRFNDDNEDTIVAFDLTRGYLQAKGRNSTLKLGPTLMNGLRQFFAEQTPSS